MGMNLIFLQFQEMLQTKNHDRSRYKKARGVIITTGDDVDNLFITLTAREISSKNMDSYKSQ